MIIDPISIISALLLLGSAVTVVYLIVITIIAIYDWFESRESLLDADKDTIAFTISEKLRTGKVKIIQGFWNRRTDKLQDARVVEGERLDAKMASLHEDDELVMHQR